MSRMPKVEIKTIVGTVEEIQRHLDTEQVEKKSVKKAGRKKAEKVEKPE